MYPPAIEGIVKRRGDRLPHWTAERAIYHVVFRLADSLPAHVLRQFNEEREQLLRRPGLAKEDRARLEYLVSDMVEAYLDSGAGACLMENPRIADLVAGALAHFDTERYDLHAWCVMPNHVHLVIQPIPGYELAQIMHSLKSFTAHAINRELGRKGKVWMPEYYDHLLRTEAAYARVVDYVVANPQEANLKAWKWVCRSDRRDGGATLV